MTKRIFCTILTMAICIFIVCGILFMTVLYDYFSSVQQNHLKAQLDLASQGVSHEGSKYFDDFNAGDYRITWIGTDGSVLYDSASDVQDMENHFQREEVKQALSEGYGESSRYSSTLTERYLYSAKRLDDGTVLRLSVTQNSLLSLTLGMLQPISVILVIAILLSVFLAYRLSKKIVYPINNLNLDEPLNNKVYEEITPLLNRMNIQQRQIRNQKAQLKQKQNEFETLTQGMSEGIVLLDGMGFILSINPSAEKLFHTDSKAIGKNMLNVYQNPEFSRLISQAEIGVHAEKVMSFENGIYRFSANPVIENNKIHGIALLLLDVTEKEKSEEMRQEFTANVSHELKTPLHTISGYAELLSNGMVKSQDVPNFSQQIYTESQRMIRLVEDIINLSHLDEGSDDMKWEKIDLHSFAKNTVASLVPEAENSEVTLNVQGDSALLYGIPQLLESIVYNLCDNAIKYNKKGGAVWVNVEDNENSVILSVKDTGIGIPTNEQTRIFERFYRVDKSHSKEIGGTGLGLSIVKHAVRLQGATIDVESVIDEGTTITVTFPKEQLPL